MQRAPSGISRKHHFVSQGYLAQFTNTGTSKGMLCGFDLSTYQCFRAKPEAVAFEVDFNRIEMEGTAPDAIEMALSRFEGRAIRAIREICRTGKLPSDDAFSYRL
jgi:hypothetical protein